jgi:hypothetical protein
MIEKRKEIIVSCSMWGVFSPTLMHKEYTNKAIKFSHFLEPYQVEVADNKQEWIQGGGLIEVKKKYEEEALIEILRLLSNSYHVISTCGVKDLTVHFDFYFSYETNWGISAIQIQQLNLLKANIVFGTIYFKLKNVSIGHNPEPETKKIVINGSCWGKIDDKYRDIFTFKIEDKYGSKALEEAINLLIDTRKTTTWDNVESVNIRIGYFYNYESRWAISSQQVQQLADLGASVAISCYYMQPETIDLVK